MNIFNAFTPGEMLILGIIIGILLSVLVYIILGEKNYCADDEAFKRYPPDCKEFLGSLVDMMETLEEDETLIIHNDNDEIQVFQGKRY